MFVEREGFKMKALNKEKWLRITGLIFSLSIPIILCLSACSEKANPSEEIYKRRDNISTAIQAKELLIEGNRRFVSGQVLNHDLSKAKRNELAENGQHPFAIILSCSDSRVPPEIIFDQALGDIFSIRNAGNVVDPVVIGSIEYGADHLHVPLIVVLGHKNCGAVKATVDGGEAPGSIAAIVDKIKPIYDSVKETTTDTDELYEKCENENIEYNIAEIEKSPIIKELKDGNKIEIIGAKYDIDTGEVVFY